MRLTQPLRAVALLAVALVGCSSNPTPTSRPRFDASLITREQIQAGQYATAYDAVKTLRGTWLNLSRPESFRYPSVIQVYLDNVRIGDVSTLSTIQTLPIQFIRFYNGQEATAKWGVDHGAGAIFVSTKVGPKGSSAPPA
jgi:hypothetical protein